MHGPTPLAGPVWVVAQIVMVSAIALSMFMLLDSLRAVRRAQEHGVGLWVYRVLSAGFLILFAAVQLIPGIQLGAAISAATAPFILVLGLVYLLRVVFPKQAPVE